MQLFPSFNWIDLIIVALMVYSAIDGWQRGFVALVGNFISFLGSLWFAVHFHTVVGNFFTEKFGITVTWALVLGYLFVAVISQVVIEMLCSILLSKLPHKILNSKHNSLLGSIISFIDTLVISSFVLILVLALPLRGTVRQDIQSSVLGSRLVRLAETYGGQVRSSLETIAANATKFLTVEPDSQESIPLDVPGNLTDLTIDAADEQQMVRLVNSERAKQGVAALSVDGSLTKLAEDKSRDMFVRRYFSHYDPDGKNAADRMTDAGIPFNVAGENLAYAPDLMTAHNGLMNSPGHRANILDTRFHKVGIGIINGGIYGKMFTQEFTD